MENTLESPKDYLETHGLELWKFSWPDPRADKRIIFKKGEGPDGEPIGEYSGQEVIVINGLENASSEYVLEHFIKPIVEKYVKM